MSLQPPSLLPASVLPASVPALPAATPPVLREAAKTAAASVANAAPQAARGLPTWLLVSLLILGALALIAGGYLVYTILRKRRSALPAVSGPELRPQRLLSVWQSFLSSLPAGIRSALAEHTHFIVLGPAGAGKTTLITRMTDWRGQSSQLIPSYTADPLLQIYLGSRVVVQEIAASLIESTSGAVNQALTRLWRGLHPRRPPIVIIVLGYPTLRETPPDQLRQQAYYLRGKLNLLSEAIGTPLKVRVCLTNADRMTGYSALARCLCADQTELTLDLSHGTVDALGTGFTKFQRHLPRALTTQSTAAFDTIVSLFQSAPAVFERIGTFLQALLTSSVVASRPELTRLYLSSPEPQEHVGSPFESAGSLEAKTLPRYWLWRYLTLNGALTERPLHSAASGLLLLLIVSLCTYGVRRHGALVHAAEAEVEALGAAVQRARSGTGPANESEVVRRADLRASQHMDALFQDETRFFVLRLLYQRDKRELRRRFAAALREGYLLPVLDAAVRQRSRDRILHALAALYATRDNTLGTLVRSHAQEFAQSLAVPQDSAVRYVRYGDQPFTEIVLATPPLARDDGTQASRRRAAASPEPWQQLVGALSQDLDRPFLTQQELQARQNEAKALLEVIAQIRTDGTLRQIYRMLAEESPLDVVKLFGADGGTIEPAPWLADNLEAMEGLFTLVKDSSLQGTGSRLSLYRLLKWLNETEKKSRPLADSFRITLPERTIEISKQRWSELLFRSRKRLVLGGDSVARSDGNRTGCAAPSAAPLRNTKRRRVPAKRAGGACSAPSVRDRDKTPLAAAQGVGPFTKEELAPRLASLLTADETPPSGLSDLYNRVVLFREVVPLVQELRKALATNESLSADEKIWLSRTVQAEVRGYASRYCAALMAFHLSFELPSGSLPALQDALIEMVKPGSAFAEHLRLVADNARLEGLTDPYLRPMLDCAQGFQPLVKLMTSKEGSYPALDPYNTIVASLVQELRAPAGSADGGTATEKPAPGSSAVSEPDPSAVPGLWERLSALGQSTLRVYRGDDKAPLRQAEMFLDKAGILGKLRQPFLLPFSRAYQHGVEDIERAVEQAWQKATLPLVQPLLSGFPFAVRAEREVSPDQLEVLSPSRGALARQLRTLYQPVLLVRGESIVPRPPATPELPALRLPRGMPEAVERLSRLGQTLFLPDGARRPLRFLVRPQPLPVVGPEREAQPTAAYLKAGRSSVLAFNQAPLARPLEIDWWDQGTAAVVLESSSPASNRRQSQSIEISDSTWSFYRLLLHAQERSGPRLAFVIPGDAPPSERTVTFYFEEDPWAPFRIEWPR